MWPGTPVCSVPTASCVSLRPVGRRWKALSQWRCQEEDAASQTTALPTRYMTAELCPPPPPQLLMGHPLWWLLPAHLGSPSWAPHPRVFLSASAPMPLCLWPDACLSLSPFPQDPKVYSIFPTRGPRAGGTCLTLHGSKLLTGRLEDIRVVVGDQPCHL